MQWEDRIGRRIKFRDLHIALAVAQSGSMLKAAEVLAISQPVVSKVIADLEQALGVRLFDRSRKGVEPTASGRALLNRGRAAFDELNLGVKEIEYLNDPTTGELRIGSSPALSEGIVFAIVDRLSRQYPRVVIQVALGGTQAQFDELRERRIDLGFARMPGSVPPEDMDQEVLFEDPLVVVAGMKNPWARRRKIELAELIDEPWILSPPDTTNYRAIIGAFRAQGLAAPRIGLKTLSTHLRANLVGSGKFIAPFPNTVFSFYAERFALKALPIALPIWPWPVVILTLKNRTLSPVVQSFLDHLRNFFASSAREGERRKRGT